MEQQCLATLQTLLSGGGAAMIEQPLLENFYKHCARQPAVCRRHLATVSLKTLLYHYACLRPEIQATLGKFVTDHWRIYAAETPLPKAAPDASQTDPAPTVPISASTPVAPPTVDRLTSPAIRDDWFDRFLDGVRILLFL